MASSTGITPVSDIFIAVEKYRSPGLSDAETVQRAVDGAAALGYAGVSFGTRTYSFDKTIQLRSGIQLQGVETKITWADKDAAAFPFFRAQGIHDASVGGFNFEWTTRTAAAPTPQTHAIVIQDSSAISVAANGFYSTKAVHIISSSNIEVTHNDILGGPEGVVIGFLQPTDPTPSVSHDIVISGNVIAGQRREAIDVNSDVIGVRIDNNIILGGDPGRRGIELIDELIDIGGGVITNVEIFDNRLHGIGLYAYGLRLKLGVEHAAISDNIIEGFAKTNVGAGINVANSSDFSIKNNSISGAVVGIKLEGIVEGSVTGNKAFGAAAEVVKMVGALGTVRTAENTSSTSFQDEDYIFKIAGSGADTLTGEQGNDVFLGARGKDTLIGQAGVDLLLGNSGDDVLKGGADADQLLGGRGRDHLDGGSGDDTLAGGDENDFLFGSSGQDRLLGEDGNDYLSAGSGNDLCYGGTGNDTVFGGDGADTLDGGAGTDDLDGGLGNDSLSDTGGAGERFRGGAGDDTLTSSSSTSTAVLHGGEGNDTYRVGSPLNGVVETDDLGFDLIILTFATPFWITPDRVEAVMATLPSILFGSRLNNAIYGSAGSDMLYGMGGDDTIYGGAGDDVIITGSGRDIIFGGAGANLFYVSSLDNVEDRIMDYDPSKDRIIATGMAELSHNEILHSGNFSSTPWMF